MNLTLTLPPPFLSGYGTTSIKPILNSFMKIIITLKLLFLIAVIDFFSGGGGRREGDCQFSCRLPGVQCTVFPLFSFLLCFGTENGLTR